MAISHKIALCAYPFALKSAIYGLEEMFVLANDICKSQQRDELFDVEVVSHHQLVEAQFAVVILPPSNESEFYLNPTPSLVNWLEQQHQQGAVMASACAGAFILNQTRSVAGRVMTTHWGLAERFRQHFPSSKLETDALIIDHGDVVTAGGMMSWVDLGLELIKRFTSVEVMRQLGKTLVIDTAPREQRFYQQFTPTFQHQDKTILKVQHYLQAHYQFPIEISALAEAHHITLRTLQRRFAKATGESPARYVQKLKVQKACDLLESSNMTFERISAHLGYHHVAAFRKIFVNIMGLTPSEFRKRFSGR